MAIIFLAIYGGVNLFGLLFLGFDIAYTTDKKPSYFLVFPMIWERLREDLNIAGSIIAIALFGIGLLPAVLVLYVGELFLLLVAIVVVLFQEIFKRRD